MVRGLPERQKSRCFDLLQTRHYCAHQYDIDRPKRDCYIRFKSRGAVAQLGERMNGIHEAVGSIPSSSTKKIKKKSRLGNP